MVIKVYGILPSPPVRATIFTLKALDLPYEFVKLDMANKEHLEAEYLKINPHHTVPTLVDEDGFVVYDSHAINAYLVNKYAKEDNKLYPKDPKKKSMVDRRMYFDDGVLFANIRNIAYALIFEKTETRVSEKMVTKIENDCYTVLENILSENDYVAGNDLTIADFSIVTTLSNANLLIPINVEKFPLIHAYMKRCKENIADFDEINEEGLKQWLKFMNEFGFDLSVLEV